MNIQEIRDRAPDGAKRYLIINGEVWYIKWSDLIGEYLTYDNGKWYTFIVPDIKELKPLY